MASWHETFPCIDLTAYAKTTQIKQIMMNEGIKCSPPSVITLPPPPQTHTERGKHFTGAGKKYVCALRAIIYFYIMKMLSKAQLEYNQQKSNNLTNGNSLLHIINNNDSTDNSKSNNSKSNNSKSFKDLFISSKLYFKYLSVVKSKINNLNISIIKNEKTFLEHYNYSINLLEEILIKNPVNCRLQ